MTPTKEQREKAYNLAAKYKVTTLFVNKMGEFFTNENLASISVKGKKEDFAKIEINPKQEANDKK